MSKHSSTTSPTCACFKRILQGPLSFWFAVTLWCLQLCCRDIMAYSFEVLTVTGWSLRGLLSRRFLFRFIPAAVLSLFWWASAVKVWPLWHSCSCAVISVSWWLSRCSPFLCHGVVLSRTWLSRFGPLRLFGHIVVPSRLWYSSRFGCRNMVI